MLERIPAEARPERIKILRPHLQPRGHLMAAVGIQVLTAMFEGARQMKPANRPSAPLADHSIPDVFVEGDHDRGLAESIDDPRRHDPDHAGMPALRAKHDRAAIIAV